MKRFWFSDLGLQACVAHGFEPRSRNDTYVTDWFQTTGLAEPVEIHVVHWLSDDQWKAMKHLDQCGQAHGHENPRFWY